MAQQTAVDWLIDQVEDFIGLIPVDIIEQAKQMENEKIIEHLIGFQIYLNNKGLITNHEWDFEKLAKQYIKKEYK